MFEFEKELENGQAVALLGERDWWLQLDALI
jgi:hypothetical protein